MYSLISFGRGNFSVENRAALLQEISEEMIPARLEIGDLSRSLFDAVTAFITDPAKAQFGEYRMRIGEREEKRGEFSALVHFAFKLRDECKRLAARMRKTARKLTSLLGEDESEETECFELPVTELNSYATRLDETAGGVNILFDIAAADREIFVHFFTAAFRRNAVYPAFHSLPIEVSKPMLEYCFKKIPCTVLVSGTMTTAHDFSFIRGRLGLDSDDGGVESRYVLEVNRGWARAHGVRPGDRVRFENVLY